MWAYSVGAMAKKTTAKKKAPAKKVPSKKAPAKKVAAKKRSAAARPAKRAASARKAAPKPRVVAKKRRAAAKKAPPAKKKAPARAKARPAVGVRRRDGAGHLDPKYARDLLEKSGVPEAQEKSFVDRPRSKDDLVEELGEEFVEQATSAEHEGEDVLDQEVPEDRGGPFVETTAEDEFAYGTDLSNPKGAKREPFPTT
jgi:hypothetical protein